MHRFFENQPQPLILTFQITQRACDNRTASSDNAHVIGNLLDLGQLMG